MAHFYFLLNNINNFFFFQAEDGIRYGHVTGVQTCALPIWASAHGLSSNEGCHRHQSPSGRAARSSISASSRMCRRTRMSSPCRRSSNTARRLSSGNSAMSPAEGPQLGSGAASSPAAVARFALPRGRRRYQSPISAQAHGGINVNVATTAVVSLREYAAASATALSSMWTTASAIPARSRCSFPLLYALWTVKEGASPEGADARDDQGIERTSHRLSCPRPQAPPRNVCRTYTVPSTAASTAEPNTFGSVASCVRLSSSRPMVKWSTTSSDGASSPASVMPMRTKGNRRAVHMSLNRTSSDLGTATIARAVDSENSAVNTSTPSRSHTSSSQIRAPVPKRRQDSTSACDRPPSDRSWAASIMPSRELLMRISPSSFSASGLYCGGTPPRWPAVTSAQAEPSSSASVVPSR